MIAVAIILTLVVQAVVGLAVLMWRQRQTVRDQRNAIDVMQQHLELVRRRVDDVTTVEAIIARAGTRPVQPPTNGRALRPVE